MTLEQAIDRKNNNFNLIRLLAAILVIFGHSFYLFPTNGYKEPTSTLFKGDYTGSLAVYIFFFLSGIFIVSSFVNSKTFFRFILMRVLRIYPALIICNVITVFIVGATFTTLSISSYFSSKDTWTYFVGNNLMVDYIPNLPGVFRNNFFTATLNGSLWTLPVEIRCYLVITLLGVLGFFKKNKVFLKVSFFFVAYLIFRNSAYIMNFFHGAQLKALFFFMGMLAYTFRKYVIINNWAALILIVACIVSHFINYKLFINIFYFTLIYSVLAVSTLNVVKKVKLSGDYSYGIYIYGFLIQQIIAHFFPKLTSYPSMLISMPLVFLLGVISWHYVELPALDLAKKLSQKYEEGSELHQKDLQLKNIVSN